MKKRLSYIVDGLLVAIILILGYTQISMMITRGQNHGVPKAFGLSFLYIATDSMEIPDDSNSLGVGTGIVIATMDPKDLTPSTPIYEKNEDGEEIYYKIDESGEYLKDESNNRIISDNQENAKRRIIDYELDGNIVTFYDEAIKAPNTHRLIEKRQDESGEWHLKTMGDNPKIHERFRIYPETESANIVQTWTKSELIGTTIIHSKILGEFLVISSPAIAATAFDSEGHRRTAWLLPVVIIVLVIALAVGWMVKTFIKLHKEQVNRDALIKEAMIKAGIDMNDEAAVELFRTKEELRLDYKEEMEKELKRQKEMIKKIEEKALKEARKELKKKENR